MTDTDMERAVDARVEKLKAARPPGPYHFDPQNIGLEGCGLLDANGDSLGVTIRILRQDDWTRVEALGLLLATAPDMLDALQHAEAALSIATTDGYDQVPDPEAVLAIVREAIAKATGGR